MPSLVLLICGEPTTSVVVAGMFQPTNIGIENRVFVRKTRSVVHKWLPEGYNGPKPTGLK